MDPHGKQLVTDVTQLDPVTGIPELMWCAKHQVWRIHHHIFSTPERAGAWKALRPFCKFTTNTRWWADDFLTGFAVTDHRSTT